jgi:hypothetical protein
MHPIKSKALLQENKILEDQVVALGLWKPIRSCRAKPGSDLAHARQQIVHVLRPQVVVTFRDKQAIA